MTDTTRSNSPVRPGLWFRAAQVSVPFGLVCGYIVFLPVHLPLDLGFRAAPSDLFLISYLALMATRLRTPGHVWSVWHVGLPLVIVLGVLVALITTGSLTVYAVLQKGVGIFVLVGAFVMIVDAAARFGSLTLIRLMVAAVVVHAAVAIGVLALQQSGSAQLSWINYAGYRLSGLLVDPNAFGGLLAVTFLLHHALRRSVAPLFSRPRGLACDLILAAGLLLTFSRSAWLGMGLGLAAWLLLRPKAALGAVGWLTLGAAGIVAAFGAGFLGVVGWLAFRPAQVSSRIELLRLSIETFLENPVLGVGTGVFLERHGEIVHSTAFWLLAETGLLGLLAFAGFVLWFVRRGVASYRREVEPVADVILALLLAHLTMIGVSMGIEALYQRHWWLVMGLLAVATRPTASGSDSGD